MSMLYLCLSFVGFFLLFWPLYDFPLYIFLCPSHRIALAIGWPRPSRLLFRLALPFAAPFSFPFPVGLANGPFFARPTKKLGLKKRSTENSFGGNSPGEKRKKGVIKDFLWMGDQPGASQVLSISICVCDPNSRQDGKNLRNFILYRNELDGCSKNTVRPWDVGLLAYDKFCMKLNYFQAGCLNHSFVIRWRFWTV